MQVAFLLLLPVTASAGARSAFADGQAHWKRGNSFYKHGKLDRAVAEYQTAIRLNPNFADAHFNLATALDHRGQFDPAVSEYLEAIRLAPSNTLAHNNLGVIFYRRGQIDAAASVVSNK